MCLLIRSLIDWLMDSMIGSLLDWLGSRWGWRTNAGVWGRWQRWRWLFLYSSFFSLVILIYLDKSCGDDFFDIEERNGDETTTKAETKPDVVAAEDEAAAEKIKKLNITAKEFVPPVHSWNTVPVI